MSDLYIAAVCAGFLGLGLATPFVMALSYVWVDSFYPQYLSSLLERVPVAQVTGIGAVAVYLLLDRRAPPRLGATTWLTLLMALWVTLTATWAVAPEPAWIKWDWAFKTVVFSSLIPFFFRSRVQIEAFLQVYLLSATAIMLPVGIKTLVSGGGYNINLTDLPHETPLSEGSGLATVACMFIPIILFLMRRAVILPPGRLTRLMYGAILAVNMFAAIGTYARTSVIGFAVVAANLWWRSRRKALFAAVVALLVLAAMSVTSSGWKDRIDTIASYHSENSAYTRILVWRWTLDFVAEYPFGGGFMSYVVDRIDHAAEGDEPAWVEFGRAFHSVYFEVLGEHGWLGLGLYGAIVASALLALHAVSRRARGIEELAWCADLAAALQCALLTLLACGAFIGIAFQPMIWYMFALSVCLRSHLHRVERRRAGEARERPA